ncbi:MAG: hypothetical protein JXR58_03690 [Bacteroidales bacterium]|nr:hypothetical protein [Bacteroidales bacterium]
MRKLLFIILLGLGFTSYSQDTTEIIDLGKYKFSAISIYSDANKYEYTSDDLNLMYDIIRENVESEFAFHSLFPASYKTKSVSYNGISFIFTRSELRSIEFGISFSSQENRTNWFIYDKYVRVDTIPDLDHTFYLDTAYRRFQGAIEDLTTLNLNFRKIHRSNPKKSFIAYGGFGFSMGLSVVSRIITQSYQYTYLKYEIDSLDYFNFSKVYDYQQNPDKIYEVSQSLFARLYIPFGVNLAFSTDDSFFKKLHIDIRSCFGFEHQQVFGNAGYLRSFYTFGLGLRYAI